MSRTAWVALGGIALALCLGVPLVSGTYLKSLSPTEESVPPGSAGEGDESASGTDPDSAPEPSAVDETLAEVRAAWLECTFSTPSLHERRTCLHRKLAHKSLEPEDLALLVCSDGALDTEEELLVEVILDSWPPLEALDHLLLCLASCAESEERWLALIDAQVAGDPEWASVFVETVRGRDFFDGGSDHTLLRIAAILARHGDAGLRHVLRDGARGKLGGTERQVALALESTARSEEDAASRIEFLESVAFSPAFLGRDLETSTLVSLLLDRACVSGDPKRALALLRELLRGARTKRATATRVLSLEDWGCLPRELEGERDSLLKLAEEGAQTRS